VGARLSFEEASYHMLLMTWIFMVVNDSNKLHEKVSILFQQA
jgi:hypothetical protein